MTLVITYERLTVPQIFQKALDVFRHRYHVFLTLSTIVVVPMMAFGLAISSYAFASLTDVMESFNKLTEDQAAMIDNASSTSSSAYENKPREQP